MEELKQKIEKLISDLGVRVSENKEIFDRDGDQFEYGVAIAYELAIEDLEAILK